SSHDQLPHRLSCQKQSLINFFAFFKFAEGLHGRTFITIHFPASTALTVLSLIHHKSPDVIFRVSQEKAYLMGELSLVSHSVFQDFNSFLCSLIAISLSL